jgi:hypothetical protein
VLRHPGAFELVATSEGATLLWAQGGCSSGIELQRFDAEGRANGAVTRIAACPDATASAAAEVTDLSAAVGGGKLGVAWITRNAGGAQVFGTHGADSGAAWAPTLQLGAAEPKAGSLRGQLSLVASNEGRHRVSWSGLEGPCSGESARCAHVVSTPLPPAHNDSEPGAPRRLDTREIPQPCPRLLVGSLFKHGVWYDAFCAFDPARAGPVTEVYAIKPEIFYAEASPVLHDCTPLGVAPSQEGVLILGECPDGLRVHALDSVRSRNSVIVRPTRTLACAAGRPVLSLRAEPAAGGASDVYRLTGPMDRLEGWLPADIAGAGSRAAFTGRRLLVARVRASADPKKNRLLVTPYRCEGESVVSEPPAML